MYNTVGRSWVRSTWRKAFTFTSKERSLGNLVPMLRLLRRPLPDPACANFTRLLEEASTNAFEAMKFRALEAKPKSSMYYYIQQLWYLAHTERDVSRIRVNKATSFRCSVNDGWYILDDEYRNTKLYLSKVVNGMYMTYLEANWGRLFMNYYHSYFVTYCSGNSYLLNVVEYLPKSITKLLSWYKTFL